MAEASSAQDPGQTSLFEGVSSEEEKPGDVGPGTGPQDTGGAGDAASSPDESLNSGPNAVEAPSGESDPLSQLQLDAKPDWLPEKFWDAENRQPKFQDLVKSYNELGEKIREKNEPPESYEVKLPEGVEQLTEDDQALFKELNLSNDQAQQLVDVFYEQIVPEITEAKASVQKERLARVWNVDPESEALTARLAKVKTWAEQNLPQSVVQELSQSASGVNAIFKMMEAGAQVNLSDAAPARSRMSERELQDLMEDPRYHTDDDYKQWVHRKFQEVYD